MAERPTAAIRGLSLPEVLVAGGLVLLLMGVLIATLLPAVRYSAEGSARVELQQAGVLALQKIVADLQKTTTAGISFKAPPVDALAINLIASIDSVGQRIWSDELHLYSIDATKHTLALTSLTANSPLTAFPNTLGSSEVSNLATTCNPRRRILAFNVELFEITPYLSPTSTTPAQPLSLRLSLAKDLPHTSKRAQIHLLRSVFLRNSWPAKFMGRLTGPIVRLERGCKRNSSAAVSPIFRIPDLTRRLLALGARRIGEGRARPQRYTQQHPHHHQQ